MKCLKRILKKLGIQISRQTYIKIQSDDQLAFSIMDTNSIFFKKMTANAYGENGNLLDIKTQINNMKNNPSSFGYGVIDVGDSMAFGGVDSDKILFAKRDINHINNHLTDDEISKVLTNVIDKIVLGNDYYDIQGKEPRKAFIVESDSNLFLLSIRQEPNKDIVVDELTTLYNKGDYDSFDINNYLSSVLSFENVDDTEYKNYIYKNKKSNSFLRRFPFSIGSVGKSIANKIIAQESNKVSINDI